MRKEQRVVFDHFIKQQSPKALPLTNENSKRKSKKSVWWALRLSKGLKTDQENWLFYSNNKYQYSSFIILSIIKIKLQLEPIQYIHHYKNESVHLFDFHNQAANNLMPM